MPPETEPRPPAKKRRTWLYVIGGVVLVCMMTGVVLVVGGIVMFNRHVETRRVSPASAASEFALVAARFGSDQPLIELHEDTAVVHRTPERPRQPIDALHVLVYEEREQRLVRVTVPGWLLRLAPQSQSSQRRGSIRIDGIDGLDGSGSVSLEDLERHGPGLIIDGHTRRSDDRLLAWVE